MGADLWGAHRRTLCRVRAPAVTSVVFVAATVVALSGCSDSHTAAPAATAHTGGLRFVAAPRALLTKCRATARAVGYPVPCPTHIPAGLAVGSSTRAGCLDIIGPGGIGGCAKSWRDWVVGTANVRTEHLVITASPRPLTNDAKLVNGPAWYPRARVRVVGRVSINRWRMRAVYVPPATNDGS